MKQQMTFNFVEEKKEIPAPFSKKRRALRKKWNDEGCKIDWEIYLKQNS